MYDDIQASPLHHFEVIEKLGEGSFSCVYKVQRVDDKKMYAMKKVKIGEMREKEKENALNEVRILASINHPNIVNYRQAFFDERTRTLCVVMELADGGDIQKKVNEHLRLKTYFTQRDIWAALVQMTRGLKALHQNDILHRDLKCANVFATADGRYKLGDLNVSKVVKKGMARTQTGTPYYTSPEVWNDRPYDSKCDIWSLGCVVYEMAALKPPFRANNLKELYQRIQRGIYDNIPSFYSDQLKSIISQCLKVNPVARPSANDLLNNASVMRNTPKSCIDREDFQSGEKTSLLRTIMVPKNLRSLKQALPASNYNQQQYGLNRPSHITNQPQSRVASISPRNISGNDSLLQDRLPYNVVRRPVSNSQKNQPQSGIDVLNRPPTEVKQAEARISRNNSVGSIRENSSNKPKIEPPLSNRVPSKGDIVPTPVALPTPVQVNYRLPNVYREQSPANRPASGSRGEPQPVLYRLPSVSKDEHPAIYRPSSASRQQSPSISRPLSSKRLQHQRAPVPSAYVSEKYQPVRPLYAPPRQAVDLKQADRRRNGSVDSDHSVKQLSRQASREKMKVDMQDITNRCRQIQNRVKNLINQRQQAVDAPRKPANEGRLPLAGRQDRLVRNNSYQSRERQSPANRSIDRSRNASIEVKRYDSSKDVRRQSPSARRRPYVIQPIRQK